MAYRFDGQRLTLNRSNLVGEGMQAEVFDIGAVAPGMVGKIYFPPTHQNYAGDDPDAKRERAGAKKNLAEMQEKLPALVDLPLPPEVIKPAGVITTDRGKIAGYAMPFVKGAVVLRQVIQRDEREALRLDGNEALDVLRTLYPVLPKIHGAKAVIGDFNYQNVLVVIQGGKVSIHIIDADSMDIPGFHCRGFTDCFVDPQVCEREGSGLLQSKPHTPSTDFYAFDTMLFMALTGCHPFGGKHKPPKGDKRLSQGLRQLAGIWAIHPHVKYPGNAVPFRLLDDDLAGHFESVFAKGTRNPIDKKLLGGLQWTTCSQCNLEHLRKRCPDCSAAAPVEAVVERVTVGASLKREFVTSGMLLNVVSQDKLRFVYAQGGNFMREGGRVLMPGTPVPTMRFGVSGDRTLVAQGNQLAVLDPKSPRPRMLHVDTFRGKFPVFGTTVDRIFRLENGKIQREDSDRVTTIGSVMQHHSLFWVGPKFGFGYSQAQGLQQGFMFSTSQMGLNDSITLPRMRGDLVAARSYFSDHRVWAFLVHNQGRVNVVRCFVLKPSGELVAEAEAEESDGSWLGSIGGKCAVTLPGSGGTSHRHTLFSGTDDGLVRVILDGSTFQVKEFDGTGGMVDSSTSLHLGPGGFYVARRRDIQLLTPRA